MFKKIDSKKLARGIGLAMAARAESPELLNDSEIMDAVSELETALDDLVRAVAYVFISPRKVYELLQESEIKEPTTEKE